MKELYIKDILNNLYSYKNILISISTKKLGQQIKEIDEIVSMLEPIGERCIQELLAVNEHKSNLNGKWKSEKMVFKEITELWNHKEFEKIKGTKLNYHYLNDNSKIVAFIKSKNKDEVLKETTILDFNLIYYILTGNCKEIKKKKEDFYDLITSYLKANKQGEAFSKLIEEK